MLYLSSLHGGDCDDALGFTEGVLTAEGQHPSQQSGCLTSAALFVRA